MRAINKSRTRDPPLPHLHHSLSASPIRYNNLQAQLENVSLIPPLGPRYFHFFCTSATENHMLCQKIQDPHSTPTAHTPLHNRYPQFLRSKTFVGTTSLAISTMYTVSDVRAAVLTLLSISEEIRSDQLSRTAYSSRSSVLTVVPAPTPVCNSFSRPWLPAARDSEWTSPRKRTAHKKCQRTPSKNLSPFRSCQRRHKIDRHAFDHPLTPMYAIFPELKPPLSTRKRYDTFLFQNGAHPSPFGAPHSSKTSRSKQIASAGHSNLATTPLRAIPNVAVATASNRVPLRLPPGFVSNFGVEGGSQLATLSWTEVVPFVESECVEGNRGLYFSKGSLRKINDMNPSRRSAPEIVSRNRRTKRKWSSH